MFRTHVDMILERAVSNTGRDVRAFYTVHVLRINLCIAHVENGTRRTFPNVFITTVLYDQIFSCAVSSHGPFSADGRLPRIVNQISARERRTCGQCLVFNSRAYVIIYAIMKCSERYKISRIVLMKIFRSFDVIILL